MYFLVSEGTESFAKLRAVDTRMQECHAAARDFLRRHGWLGQPVVDDRLCVAGGITGIAFAEPPAHWKVLTTLQGHTFYTPRRDRKATRALHAELHDLPAVTWQDLNRTIGNNDYFSVIGVTDLGTSFLLELTKEMAFTATDLVEILSADYHARLAAHEAAPTAPAAC